MSSIKMQKGDAVTDVNENSVDTMTALGWNKVKGAKPVAEVAPVVAPALTPEEQTARLEARAVADEAATSCTVAQLKEALDGLHIAYAASAPKAALLKLFLDRP